MSKIYSFDQLTDSVEYLNENLMERSIITPTMDSLLTPWSNNLLAN
nr:hypothetical protein [Bacillus cereus]